MTRLVLREVARWMRALGAPLTVLGAVVLAPTLLPAATGAVLKVVPQRTASMAWVAAGAATLVWLVVAWVRAALQPAQDECAAARLQELRDRATLQRHMLVFVLETHWESPAGQRAGAVDVRTGEIREVWLSECSVEPGSLALLVGSAGSWRLVDCANPRQVAASRRHERAVGAYHRVRSARAATRAHRRERKAAAEVVRAAEGLLR